MGLYWELQDGLSGQKVSIFKTKWVIPWLWSHPFHPAVPLFCAILDRETGLPVTFSTTVNQEEQGEGVYMEYLSFVDNPTPPLSSESFGHSDTIFAPFLMNYRHPVAE